ncbi:MAG: hypothetical protein ACJ79K_13760 [Gemmatimonadaceae bacterium]
MSEVDWKSKLREIEREYDGLPPEPSPSKVRARKTAEQAALARVSRRWVIVRVVLVLALSVAIVFWPYEARCGFPLAGYLAAIATVALGGIWIAVLSWHHRMPVSHAISMLVLVWGLAIFARETLPRIGYARPDAARAAWRCAQ